MGPVFKLIVTFLIIFSFCPSLTAQPNLVSNNYKDEKGLPRLNIERAMIYSPKSAWFYNHHPAIINFKGRFIATWSDGLFGEDSPGQRVVYSVSDDFYHWSPVKVLANPAKGPGDTLNVLTAAGLYKFKDTLVAYYGQYEQHRTNTQLFALYSTDGEHWSAPIDMHLPLIPNHGPEPTKSGRLIISGNFSFPYTDNPDGLSGWKMSGFYPPEFYTQDNSATFYKPAQRSGLPPLCEGSFFQTDDNIIHMLLRVTGKGWKGHLWITESRDNGTRWSRPVEANFTDNDSKFHFGRLPDGKFYYAGIPDTLRHYERSPLVLSLSKDGKFFNLHYIIANEPYTLKHEGLYKGGQYGYPHTMIWQGYMYVIVSRQKESIEVIRFKLNQL